MVTNNKGIRILNFDPALSHAGWSVVDFDDTTGKLTVMKFGHICPNKIASRANMRPMVEQFGTRLISLVTLRASVEALIKEHNPDYIVVEDAFFNSKFPNACMALLQWITTVELLAYQQFNMPIYRIAARAAKHDINGMGDSSKDNVQKAVLNHENIMFANLENKRDELAAMDEHEADSIAIGYCFCVRILPGLIANRAVVVPNV